MDFSQVHAAQYEGDALRAQHAAYYGQDVDDDEFIGEDGDVDLGIPADYANGGFMDESGE